MLYRRGSIDFILEDIDVIDSLRFPIIYIKVKFYVSNKNYL